jgi:hypothetical protein
MHELATNQYALYIYRFPAGKADNLFVALGTFITFCPHGDLYTKKQKCEHSHCAHSKSIGTSIDIKNHWHRLSHDSLYELVLLRLVTCRMRFQERTESQVLPESTKLK